MARLISQAPRPVVMTSTGGHVAITYDIGQATPPVALRATIRPSDTFVDHMVTSDADATFTVQLPAGTEGVHVNDTTNQADDYNVEIVPYEET